MKNKQQKNVINKTLKGELKQLMELPKVEILGENLRRMFIDYLDYEIKVGVPVYFDEFLYPLNCLFDFLDVVAKEKIKATNKKKIK